MNYALFRPEQRDAWLRNIHRSNNIHDALRLANVYMVTLYVWDDDNNLVGVIQDCQPLFFSLVTELSNRYDTIVFDTPDAIWRLYGVLQRLDGYDYGPASAFVHSEIIKYIRKQQDASGSAETAAQAEPAGTTAAEGSH